MRDDDKTISIWVKIVNLYVYSSIHIGICAFSYSLFGQLVLKQKLSLSYSSCLGLATISLYCLHRLVGINKMETYLHKGRFLIISTYKQHIRYYFLISSAFAIGLFMKMESNQQLILLMVGGLTLSYAIPIFRGKRIRDIDYIKIILIAITWSILCLLLPLSADYKISLNDLILTLSSILYFIGLTIPFDIRDIEVDNHNQVKTIANSLGIVKSSYLSIICIASSCLLVMALWTITSDLALLLSWLFISSLTIFFILNQFKYKNDLYYSLILDGMIGLFYPIYLLVSELL